MEDLTTEMLRERLSTVGRDARARSHQRIMLVGGGSNALFAAHRLSNRQVLSTTPTVPAAPEPEPEPIAMLEFEPAAELEPEPFKPRNRHERRMVAALNRRAQRKGRR